MQTSYSAQPAAAYAGLRYDASFGDVISRVSGTLQLEQIVVDSATNSGDYEVNINGTNYEYTADGTATVTEIRDGLKALIDADDEPVATTSVSTDTLWIESTDHDAGFTFSIGGTNVADMTATTLVAQEQAIPFGVVVVEDTQLGNKYCRLPRLATDLTTPGKAFGIAVADASKTTRDTAPLGGYSAGDAVSIMHRGRIWVELESGQGASVAMGGIVYARHVATGTEQLGAMRAVDDGSDTDPLLGARFTGEVSGDLAVVELNIFG